MPLDVPAGVGVFIDANLFHYAIIPVPPFTDAVLPFIDRLRAREFVGFTGFQTLADAQHKTMTSLAAIQYNLTRAGIVGWLKKHPDQVRTMAGSRPARINRRLG